MDKTLSTKIKACSCEAEIKKQLLAMQQEGQFNEMRRLVIRYREEQAKALRKKQRQLLCTDYLIRQLDTRNNSI